MVDEEIGVMYDQLLAYITQKQGYYADASVPDGEFNDHIEQDLTSAIATIQHQIRRGANIGEAATIKGYRDLRAADAEYNMRLMSRASYWTDAALEETDNIDKWTYNKVSVNLHMNGKDSGA